MYRIVQNSKNRLVCNPLTESIWVGMESENGHEDS